MCVTLPIFSKSLASNFALIPLHMCIKTAAMYVKSPGQGDLGFASLTVLA